MAYGVEFSDAEMELAERQVAVIAGQSTRDFPFATLNVDIS